MKHDSTAFAPPLTKAERRDFIDSVLRLAMSGRNQITMTAEGATMLACAAIANEKWARDHAKYSAACSDAEQIAHEAGEALENAVATAKRLRFQRNVFAILTVCPIIGAALAALFLS